jgi:predicted dehydrogenase/threonine dehydrogenase-like Zn-dependent dehydrogenase
MKQVVQPLSGGAVRVVDVPRPTIGPTEVLVRTLASVVSPGTERSVTSLAQSSLLAKARARPDLVRQVVQKARRDGVAAAARAVRTRMEGDLPLGYAAAGVVVEAGEMVAGMVPGQLVATGGAGKANHAEYQAVPGLLCAPVPDGVPPTDAAFATIGSIALHAFRLAGAGPGDRIVVVGLGLIGQLAARLARAAGCEVAGIDVVEAPVDRLRAAGALGLVEAGEDTTKAIREWARGRGADAVLVTASGRSSAVMRRAPDLCRDGASVVVVGDVGLELDRRPYYERELTVHFARSYGPGRHERSYEEWGVDLPPGLVRWTEGRNLEAVLDLLASGRLVVDDLVTHRLPIDEAAAAYEALDGDEPALGVLITYPDAPRPDGPVVLRHPTEPVAGEPGVGLVGAGAFASTVLLPALTQAGFTRFTAVASASGLSARRVAERTGFERAVSGPDAVIEDPAVDVVVIATPHDTHAALAARALRAGKHVFCEKPLALTTDELEDIQAAWSEGGGVLFVGFNRRWSPAVARVSEHVGGGTGPLVITYRVNAGTVAEKHWYHDRRQGGRLLGEVCHFVDTCSALVGDDPADVRAVGTGAPPAERLLAEDLATVLSYPDGSVAAVTYATGGHSGTEKERVEVLGRGRSAVILDFATVILDGKQLPARGKGHLEEARAFRRAIRTGDQAPARSSFATTRATLLAAAQLTSAGPR